MCTRNTQLVGGRNWLNGWQEHRTLVNCLEQTWTHWSAWTVNGHPMPSHAIRLCKIAYCNATRSQPLERLAVFADLKGTWFRCFQMFVYAIVHANALKNEQFAVLSATSFEFRHKLCHVLITEWQAFWWLQNHADITNYCNLLQWYWKVLESDGKPWKTADVGVVPGICFPGREAWMLSLPWKPPGLVALPSLWNMKQWCNRFGKNSGKLISTRF